MTITPRWTIIPPLARPTRPRHPWRRVASTTWRSAGGGGAAGEAEREQRRTGRWPRASTATTIASAPHHAGQNSRSRSSSTLALRHGSTGATAIRNSRAIPIGVDRRSKYGAPTTVRRSCSASTSSGNTVPSRTTNANTVNSTLLARNAPSRDSGESIAPGRAQPVAAPADQGQRDGDDERRRTRAGSCRPGRRRRRGRSTGRPERVRNVPRIVSANVATSRLRFQTRSIPRRSWTSTEWM